ncbi:retrovirus-related Pol polyprotein from transposon TNT 1-94 [Trichonephila clavipes]|nr:retrovirus-related Pol polyprotein from transposon TNT 1-94 [Trichonephila clavipes]
MDNFLTELGIKHEVTNSYTPEMNGVAERFNLTALDGIKTLLKSSEVPHKFWGEALLCFTYAWNRICHKDGNKTPFEKYSGRKPSVLHLKPFGCLAYAGVPKQIRKKFDMRAKMGIMMGYAQRTKGYRIWLIDENKLVETINDDFDRVKDSLTSRLVSKTSTETPSTSEKPDVSSDNHSLIPCTEVKWIRNIGRKVTGSNVHYGIEGEATRLKSFNEIERYCKRHNIEYDPSLFNFRKDNTESQGFSDLSEQQALMVEVTIPNCYKQAIRSRDASKWRDAMDKEINVMMERKVWDLVDHPDNIKILENRWVYTIKYDENNKIVRYKARLVARGNTQLRGESFDEVFSPVINFTIVAAIHDISRSRLDPNDFTVLNCIVKAHAFLSPPSGFIWVHISPYLLLRPILILVLTPSTVSKVMHPFHPLLNKSKEKNKKQERIIDSQSRRKVFVNSVK